MVEACCAGVDSSLLWFALSVANRSVLAPFGGRMPSRLGFLCGYPISAVWNAGEERSVGTPARWLGMTAVCLHALALGGEFFLTRIQAE